MLKKISKLIEILVCLFIVVTIVSCKKGFDFSVINCDDVYEYQPIVEIKFIIWSNDKDIDYNKIHLISADNKEFNGIEINENLNGTHTYAIISATYEPNNEEDTITKLNFIVDDNEKITKEIGCVSFAKCENKNLDYIDSLDYFGFFFNGMEEIKIYSSHDVIKNIIVENNNKAICISNFEAKKDYYSLNMNYSYSNTTHYKYCFAICIEFENGDCAKKYMKITPSNSNYPINLISNCY
jgi:hypothetical protein